MLFFIFVMCFFSVNRNDVQATDSLLGSNSTQGTNGTCATEFLKFEFSTWCWGFWVILILFLLLCCLCCLFCFWQQTRPRIFVRLYRSGKHGKTKQDEQILVLYVNSNQTTMLQLAKLIELHRKMPEDLVNGLRARRRSVDIFHMDQVCKIDEDHCLKDYLIKPLRSNKALGKTRKIDHARFEQAVVDVCPSLTHNPLSMMQLFNDIEQGIELVSFKSVPAIAIGTSSSGLFWLFLCIICLIVFTLFWSPFFLPTAETKTQPLAFGKGKI